MEKIKVLIVSGKLTIEHNYRETNDRIRTLLESTGRFDGKEQKHSPACGSARAPTRRYW